MIFYSERGLVGQILSMLRELGSGKIVRQTAALAQPHPWPFSVCLGVAVSIAYFLAARLSLALRTQPDNVAVFWPAAGLAAGVLIRMGPPARMPVIAGTMVATVVANVLGDRNIWNAIVSAVCNAGEAMLVAGLIARFFASPFNLDFLHRVAGLVVIAIIGSLASGIGGSIGYLLFQDSTASALTIWSHWFTSDAIGIITVAPLLIGLPSSATDPIRKQELLEGLLALAVLFVLCGLVINLPNEMWTGEVAVITLFPLLLWIAARCKPVFAAAATFIIAFAIVWTTTFGIGVFGDPNFFIADRVLSAQASIVAVSLCALVLAALFAERRQHEAALAVSEGRLQSALTAGGVIAFDWSVLTGISEHSDNAAQILGYDPKQPPTAASFLERIHPADRPHFKACIYGASPDQPTYETSFRYLNSNGQEMWLAESGRAEFNAKGQIVRVTGLTRDITERKRAEEELAIARKDADLANRAKSSFLAAASHNLRQPLQSLNLLQRTLKLHIQDDVALRLTTRIAQLLDVMKVILDSLLNLNRLESGTLVPSISNFAVNDVLESLAAVFAEPIREKGLTWRIVSSRLIVRSDKGMLEEIIRNLLSNAVRYTQRGKILVGCRLAGGNVRVEVWDTGIGIMGEHIPLIFEEHYQIRNPDEKEGTGLGLAIVQRLAKILEHRVNVRTTPGRGSAFSIELPLAGVQHHASGRLTTPIANGFCPFRGTILVIENDPFVSGGLESLLESEGVNVITATNGDEALDLVESKGIRPDLILSDLNLSGEMDGIHSIRALRAALRSKIPAIILTGEIRSKPLEALAEHGVGVALKPVDADELLQLISGTWSASLAGAPRGL